MTLAHCRRQPTARQLEILALVAGGHSYGQIGEQLGISVCTVATRMHWACLVLGVESRIEAVVACFDRGLLRREDIPMRARA